MKKPGGSAQPRTLFDAAQDETHAAFVEDLLDKARSYASMDPRVALAQARVVVERSAATRSCARSASRER